MIKDPSGREDLFEWMAAYCARCHLGLPDAFFDEVRRRFRLDGTGRMLDLGCGAGKLALALAGDFERVVAMDRKPGRIAEVLWEAERLGIENVTWMEGDIDDLHPAIGPFRLVIVDQSMYRTNREWLTLLAELTEPEGGVVIAEVDRCGPLTDWQRAVESVMRRFGEGRVDDRHPSRHLEGLIIHPSPFRRTAVYTHQWTRWLTIGEAVVHIVSTFSPRISGENRDALERELRAVLRAVQPSGVLEERLHLRAVFVWKR